MTIGVDRRKRTQEMLLNYMDRICYLVGKENLEIGATDDWELSSLGNSVVCIPLVRLGI